MKTGKLFYLFSFGLRTVLFRRRDPLIGSLILTDRCNLACRHCAVANHTGILYPLPVVRGDLHRLYHSGVRILFLFGGEPFLWHDGNYTLRDLVLEARNMGFFLIGIVTNGTISLELPEADLIMVSLDGNREHHDFIRGHSYDRILANIQAAPEENLCLYMAVNRINLHDISHVATLAQSLPHVVGSAYNFHTPYPGTEALTLSDTQAKEAAAELTSLKAKGLPILNLTAALPALLEHRFQKPCPQCLLAEDGNVWVCGRCSEVPGLCSKCGYAFATEYSLLFRGDFATLREALTTYLHIF